MSTLNKTVTYSPVNLKAPDSKGTFTAYVAQTWPEDTPKKNADADGDIFLTGAFDSQDGEEVPTFYQHDYAETSRVGVATLHPSASREVLPATGKLFLDKPIANAVYESMLLSASDPNSLKSFSVGYEVDTKDITMRPDGVRIIRKSRVLEVSVVKQGAQITQLVNIKRGSRRTVEELRTMLEDETEPQPVPPESFETKMLRKHGRIWQELQDERRARAEEAERMEKTRKVLELEWNAMQFQPPRKITIDAMMRPHDPVEEAYDAARAQAEIERMEAAERERANERGSYADAEARRAYLATLPEYRRFEEGR